MVDEGHDLCRAELGWKTTEKTPVEPVKSRRQCSWPGVVGSAGWLKVSPNRLRHASSATDTEPSNRSLWPPTYFVSACMLMSTPWAKASNITPAE